MARHRVSREELLVHLREQMSFLRSSAEAYDAGKVEEAKRLAVVLRVLLVDTKQSKSLLEQLGVKRRLRFEDTAGTLPRGEHERHADGSGRVRIVVGNVLAPVKWRDDQTGHMAPLGDHGRDLPPLTFTEWWSNVIAATGSGARFTRNDIVRAVANQDGGAHVDAALSENYHAISRGQALGTFQLDGKPVPAANPALAMIRQIAFELELTLARQLPERWLGAAPVQPDAV